MGVFGVQPLYGLHATHKGVALLFPYLSLRYYENTLNFTEREKKAAWVRKTSLFDEPKISVLGCFSLFYAFSLPEIGQLFISSNFPFAIIPKICYYLAIVTFHVIMIQ